MARLDNTRSEIFAQSLAKGTSASESYVLAGYKANDGNAIRLKGNERIKARVAELQDAATEANMPDLARCLRELGSVGFSNICNVVQWKGNQVRVIDSDEIDAASAAAVQEITQTRDGMIRIKMHAKLPALIQLIDHLRLVEDLKDKQPALRARPTGEKVIDFAAALKRYGGECIREE